MAIANLPRAEQWLRAAPGSATSEEPEIDAWIDQQVETATHRATDNPDLGPRKDGPCHDLLLEYVANRKRMAQAVSRRVQEDVGSDPAPDRDETGGVVDRHRQPDD